MEEFDLVIIGGGPAGEKAAAKAAYFKKKVALIEKQKDPGGAGVHTGTLPSKTLKETALFLSGKNDKGLFGVDKNLRRNVSIEDFYYRKNLAIESEVQAIKKNLENHNVTQVQGQGSFIDSQTIEVQGQVNMKVKGNYILIATGSEPFHPPSIPFDFKRIHDSDSILNLERFPRSICILGGGVIGSEYTTIFATKEIPVSLIDSRTELLPFLDHEISKALEESMINDNVTLILNDSVDFINVPKDDISDLEIQLGSGKIVKSDMFLFAAGRNGASKNLSLSKAGLVAGKRGSIEVNENYQTAIPHIYAVGDIIGFPALASTSMDQGRVAVSHMFKTEGHKQLSKIFPYGIYTIPEVSMVGITEEDAVAEGLSITTGKSHYANTARGRILGLKQGFLKLVASQDECEVLGVHIIGQMATEIIHYGLTLVERRMHLEDVIAEVFNYPTLHDLYKYAAYDALGNLAGRTLRES
jgi:NAD(P) transhydrogenase